MNEKKDYISNPNVTLEDDKGYDSDPNVTLEDKKGYVSGPNVTLEDGKGYVSDPNVTLENENGCVSRKKVSFDEKLICMVAKEQTKDNIRLLRRALTDDIFGRTDIAKLLRVSTTSAGYLINKMLDSELIYPVSGYGKGKYRFIKEASTPFRS